MSDTDARQPAVNADLKTVDGFGDEWSRFDQSALSADERRSMFDDYFSIFPTEALNRSAAGADFGVGSGRWAVEIAPLVGSLTCIDASDEALAVAKDNLRHLDNCRFVHASINEMQIAPESLDFAYSLGVLHHIPNPKEAMRACVRALKPGAPFLVYLYYRFDNQPKWYGWLWRASEILRSGISRAPHGLRYGLSQIVAGLVYWPLARLAWLLERLGASVRSFPLAYYRDKSFYVMRTDALDRFGTRLEQRFTRREIGAMMQECGLVDVRFSEGPPYWCAVGWKQAR